MNCAPRESMNTCKEAIVKCFILAGGSGDALWPLSRKNYPKQFINIKEGRSLFQEAIARNLPFCDEFYIITNEKYRYIVEGQLQVFQGLRYHCFLEELGRQTAPALAVACLCVDPDLSILVVSTDHMIGTGDYNGTVLRAKEALTDDNIVTIGYVNSGLFLVKAGTYLNALKENEPEMYQKCLEGAGRVRIEGGNAIVTRDWLATIPSMSVGQAVFEHWEAQGKIEVIQDDYTWSRLLDFESMIDFTQNEEGPVLLHDCQNVSVINQENSSLLIANGVQDLVVVNTKDATYISRKGDSARIRDIMEEHYESRPEIFDEGDIFYTTWGVKEILNRSEGYMVRKVTIFPGRTIGMHKHEKRSEHWSVVSGVATITMFDETREYGTNENIYVPIGTFHKICNETAKDLVVIEVCVGESACNRTGDLVPAREDIVLLEPSYKDYLWGGTRLEKLYDKKDVEGDAGIIAESWELSTHKDGQSRVAEGAYKGFTLQEYIDSLGRESLGWKCQPLEMFPLLVKFIDANKSLSIQVHPDDEFALRMEGQYGKNEMWYILDAKPDAYIYLGFQREVTREECEHYIREGTMTEILRKVPVKKGDVVFVRAGTVHAITEGILVLEIQQNSNATYRLYDYNRVGRDGKKRELHLEKAFANMDFGKCDVTALQKGKSETGKGYTRQLLGECKYFSAMEYMVEEGAELSLDESSFSSIIIVEGQGEIGTENKKILFREGDSFFIPAGRKALTVMGKCRFVLSRV